MVSETVQSFVDSFINIDNDGLTFFVVDGEIVYLCECIDIFV